MCVCLSERSDDGYCQFLASLVSLARACVCDEDRVVKNE